MNEILNAAIKYAERGWAVFPVRKNKSPYTKHGFHDASKDIPTIKKWWEMYPDANVGIATGEISNLYVIDIDNDEEHGKYGDESFNDYCDENGLYIDSLTAVTGRGGKHIYFTSSEPYGCSTNVIESVDIRGEGGYVVAPPSIHENGNVYYFDGDEDEDEIVSLQNDSDANYFFYEMLKKSSSGKSSEPFTRPEHSDQGSRNQTIFKIASSQQAKGESDEDIISYCLWYASEKCNPPITKEADPEEYETLLKTIQGVLNRYDKGEKKEQALKEKEPSKDIKFPPLIDATEIKKMEMKDLIVYVGVGEDEPLLVEGTCVLSAKSKIGKSWFSTDLCICAVNGSDFLGYKVRKCHVVYFDLETVMQLKKKRLDKLTDDSLSEGFYYVDDNDIPVPLISEGFEELLESYMEQDPQIGIVVIDVFQKVRKVKKANESDYDHTYRELGLLNVIAKKYHISIILVSHDRKTVDATDPFSNILGSTAMQGATDQMIVMYKDNFDDEFTHIAAKGRTIDGLVQLDAKIDDGMWVKSENSAHQNRANQKKVKDYTSSPYRFAVQSVMRHHSKWCGRCGEFINICKRLHIDIIDNPKDLGTFFNKYNELLLKIDSIKVDMRSNGTGSKQYFLTVVDSRTVDTVDTVDDGFITVDAPLAEEYEILFK